jgi:putative peptidoglycan lipid II flippase
VGTLEVPAPVINPEQSVVPARYQQPSALLRLLHRTTSATDTNSHRGVVNAALTIATLTAIVRMASAGKELVVAWRFGTSGDLDAFLISVLVPVTIVTVLAGALIASFIPIYIEAKENDSAEVARRFFYSVSGWVVLLLLIVAALVVVAAPWYIRILGSGFSVEKLGLTMKLVWLNSLLILFGGIASFWSAALNAERRFVVPTIAPLGTPLSILIFLWATPNWRTLALVAGSLSGAVLEVVILGIALARIGLTPRIKWPRINEKVRRMGQQFLPVMSGSVLNSGNFFVDQTMAAMLASGSVAALNYGNRVIQFPLVISSAALGTALMPHLSRLAALKDWRGLDGTVRRFIRLIFLTSLPVTAGIIIFSKPIVGLLFYRGAFTAADVDIVSRIQIFYALQIPGYLANIVIVRLISSVQLNQLILIGTAINLVLNIILNVAFMRWLGVPGIALSTSIVYLCSTAIWSVVIIRRLRRFMVATD